MLRCPAGRSRSEPGLSRAGSGWDPHLRGLPGLQGWRAQPSETRARGGSCPAAPALPARAALCRRPRGCARDSAAKPAPPPGPSRTELSPGLSPSLAEVPGRAAAVDGGVWCVWSVQEGFSQRPVCLRVCCRLPPQAPPPASRNVSRPSGPGGCRPPSAQLPGPSKPAWGPGPHPHCRVGASAGGRGSSSSCPVTPCSGQAGNPGPAQGRGAPASPRSEGKQPETGGKGSELWNSLPCLTSPCWGHAGKATENLRPATPR